MDPGVRVPPIDSVDPKTRIPPHSEYDAEALQLGRLTNEPQGKYRAVVIVMPSQWAGMAIPTPLYTAREAEFRTTS